MFKLKEKYSGKPWSFALSLQTAREFYETEPNMLHIAFFGYSYWIEVPQILKPKSVWVDLKRDILDPSIAGYTSYIHREYGFSFTEDYLHIRYGIQPGSWARDDPKNSDHSICWEIPWKANRRCHIDYLNPDGTLFKRYYDNKNGSINFSSMNEIRDATPRVSFKFKDFDGEEITATCHIEESMYRRGTKWMKWLGYIVKPTFYRRIEIDFDKETGRQKGSWKGGTMGTSSEILKDETIFDAFVRYGISESYEKYHGNVTRDFTEVVAV